MTDCTHNSSGWRPWSPTMPWWTLAELAAEAQGSEAAVSARLRDLRKKRYGQHIVERKYVGNGLWAYRLVS